MIAAQFIDSWRRRRGSPEKSERSLSQGDCLREKVRVTITGEKAIEALSEKELRELGREGRIWQLVIRKRTARHFEYFRQNATTKLDQNITHKKFLAIIERFHDRRPDEERTKHARRTSPGEQNELGVSLMICILSCVQRDHGRDLRAVKNLSSKIEWPVRFEPRGQSGVYALFVADNPRFRAV